MSATPSRFRFFAVDLLRCAALACMIVFHFAWDLDFFGLTQLGVAEHPGWQWFAKSIAGTFLFTVGVSLWLAHGDGVRWQPFWKRFALLVAVATAITLASRFFDPDGMIWFGIIHCIALSSLLGLAFVRLPVVASLLAAPAVFAAPHFLSTEALNHPGWLWLGLSTEFPPANDYIPLLPWFGNVLLGIVYIRLTLPLASLQKLTVWKPRNAVARMAVFVGQHSLIVYLVHQPLLIGALSLYTQLTG